MWLGLIMMCRFPNIIQSKVKIQEEGRGRRGTVGSLLPPKIESQKTNIII